MTRPNKLEHLPLETLSSHILDFEGKARANPIGAHLRCFLLGKLLVLSANIGLDWKVIASYKHSSLFGLVISDKGKKFYNIDPRGGNGGSDKRTSLLSHDKQSFTAKAVKFDWFYASFISP